MQVKYIKKNFKETICINLHVKNLKPSFDYVFQSFAVRFQHIILFGEKNNFTQYERQCSSISQSMNLLFK